MFINEDFFDDINTEQISTDDVEDISSSSVDLSLYKTILTVTIIKPNNIKPNLEDLKTCIKRLSYILSASSMIREISEPCIKGMKTFSKNSSLSYEEAYKLDECYIYFGIRLSVNSLTKFYNLLNFIFNKLISNTLSHVIIIDFIDKSTTVPYLYFLNTDFSYNRREEDFIKRMSAFCDQYLRTEFDYNELKKCMGLDTIKQLTHTSLSDYDDWSIKEIKLFNESHQTDNLPREFFSFL